MKITELPDQMQKLARQFRQQLDAKVEVESVVPRKFRFAVTSPRFRGIPHLRRQDQVWRIVDSVLDREQSLRVSMILAYAPQDTRRPKARARQKAGGRSSPAKMLRNRSAV